MKENEISKERGVSFHLRIALGSERGMTAERRGKFFQYGTCQPGENTVNIMKSRDRENKGDRRGEKKAVELRGHP